MGAGGLHDGRPESVDRAVIPGWLDEIEAEVVGCLCRRGPMSSRQLAEALGVSEGSAVHYIHLLASEGRLSIERVVVAGESEAGSFCEPAGGVETGSEVSDGALA